MTDINRCIIFENQFWKTSLAIAHTMSTLTRENGNHFPITTIERDSSKMAIGNEDSHHRQIRAWHIIPSSTFCSSDSPGRQYKVVGRRLHQAGPSTAHFSLSCLMGIRQNEFSLQCPVFDIPCDRSSLPVVLRTIFNKLVFILVSPTTCCLLIGT